MRAIGTVKHVGTFNDLGPGKDTFYVELELAASLGARRAVELVFTEFENERPEVGDIVTIELRVVK